MTDRHIIIRQSPRECVSVESDGETVRIETTSGGLYLTCDEALDLAQEIRAMAVRIISRANNTTT